MTGVAVTFGFLYAVVATLPGGLGEVYEFAGFGILLGLIIGPLMGIVIGLAVATYGWSTKGDPTRSSDEAHTSFVRRGGVAVAAVAYIVAWIFTLNDDPSPGEIIWIAGSSLVLWAGVWWTWQRAPRAVARYAYRFRQEERPNSVLPTTMATGRAEPEA